MMYLDNKVLQAGVTSEMEILFKHSPVMEDASHLLNEQNHNLSNPQKELLLWHYCLGHAGQHWIQDLMRKEKGPVGSVSEGAFLPTKYPSTTRIEPPKCAACLLAKQHRRGAGCQTVRPKPDKEMAIRRDVTSPGSHVSTDQWVSKIPGRLPNTYGREQEHNRYHGGTLFYDHYSGYIHIHCQIALQVGETLHGKHDFERFAELNGVKIQHYQADNQPFDSHEWRVDLETHEQTISLSGIGVLAIRDRVTGWVAIHGLYSLFLSFLLHHDHCLSHSLRH